MPSAPLLDFASLDLTTQVFSRADIYKLLRQANRFAMLDGIAYFDEAGTLSIGYKDIRADDWWAEDHIPGRPLFPGVLMIESAAQLATFDYMKRNPSIKDFLGFGGLNETRFRSAVEPGRRLYFAAQVKKVRSRMFIYSVQGFVEQELVFETEVMGVVV
jgi:3-hydroxyacyl-[acyl-carrier-protein] dehydratase